MNLHRIRLFLLTAKHLSISKAARDLHISQSTASRQLKQFQANLGIKLLTKTGRGIALTQSGQNYFNDVLAPWSQIEAVHKKYTRSEKSLILAGSHGLSTSFLPSLVTQFGKKYPSAEMTSFTGTSSEIEEGLFASQVDLAVITNPTGSPALQMEPYRREKLVAFVAPKHSLARKKSVSPSEFGDIQLIVKGRRNGQSRTETQLSDFAKRGIKFKTLTRYESSGSVKEAVRHGTGVGVLFQDTVKREIDQGEFIALQFAGLNVTRQTYIAYSKERPLSPMAREFLLLLRASAEKKVSMETVSPLISNKRRNARSPDYVLRSALASWIAFAPSLDWITSVLA
jgi:LysR family transcriptional regulator, low CO2-responsive transcriptional regulator